MSWPVGRETADGLGEVGAGDTDGDGDTLGLTEGDGDKLGGTRSATLRLFWLRSSGAAWAACQTHPKVSRTSSEIKPARRRRRSILTCARREARSIPVCRPLLTPYRVPCREI